MADNPFSKITDLEGQTFDNAQMIDASIFDSTSGVPMNTSIFDPRINPSAGNTASNLGKIHVVSTEFTPGFTAPNRYGGTSYHFATFGAIQFENFKDPDTGIVKTFYIHGFGRNGLFLTDSPDSGWMKNDTWSPVGSEPPFIATIMGFNGVSRLDSNKTLTFSGGDTFDNDPSVLEVALCFAEGTRIETASGRVAVEALAIGDTVVTASGAKRSVKWIGNMTSRPARHPRPWEVKPVRVKRHAFGENLPEYDVRLSPGHAVYVDGVLVPVGHLINGATIVQEEAEQIRYFHVELDSHDVLLAEGLPCESYFDDGNRATFTNAGAFTTLHGRLDPKSWDNACAPMVAEGPQLDAVRARLHAQAEALGWVKCEDADLVIEADGAAVMPLQRSGNRYWFALPAAESLVLRSNHGVLAHVMPSLTDGRKLGVAVSELRVNGAVVDLDSAAFCTGFYPAERHEQHGWRWTNGAAELKLDGKEPSMVEVSVIMVAPSWKRAKPALRVVA